MGVVKESLVIDCSKSSVTEINQAIRKAVKEGRAEVQIVNPLARHNLGVAVTDPVHLVYQGDVGNFAVSLSDKVTAEIRGSAGWAIGENLMSGEIVVHGNAATACAASMRGGTIIVKGNAGARSGIGLKGGTLVIGGDAGYMTGFMMQKGRMIICGDAGRAIGDSMYDGAIYVGGVISELGNGTEVVETPAEEYEIIKEMLAGYEIEAPSSFKKIRPNGMLHNFNKKEFGVWKEIL